MAKAGHSLLTHCVCCLPQCPMPRMRAHHPPTSSPAHATTTASRLALAHGCTALHCPHPSGALRAVPPNHCPMRATVMERCQRHNRGSNGGWQGFRGVEKKFQCQRGKAWDGTEPSISAQGYGLPAMAATPADQATHVSPILYQPSQVLGNKKKVWQRGHVCSLRCLPIPAMDLAPNWQWLSTLR